MKIKIIHLGYMMLLFIFILCLSGCAFKQEKNLIQDMTSDNTNKEILEDSEKDKGESNEEDDGNGEDNRKNISPVIIELDPGHGGRQPGAQNSTYGTLEKDLNLKIALYLKEELETYDNVQVHLTRSDDSELDIQERVDKAAADRADVLISLHNNTYGSIVDYDHGCTVLVPRGVYQEALSQTGQELGCYILNSLSELGIENQGLMFRISQSQTTYDNGQLCDYYGIVRHSLQAGIPGIIIEHGFMDHEQDYEQYMSDDEKVKALAKADAEGIAAYYQLTKENTDLPVLANYREKITVVKTDSAQDNEYMDKLFFTKLPEEKETKAGDAKENDTDNQTLSEEEKNNIVKKILSQMSLEEKAAQLFIITPEALTGVGQVIQAGAATKQKIKQYPVGGLIYFSQNLQSDKQVKEMLAKTQEYAREAIGLPMFLSIDEEGGTVARVGNNSNFDVPQIEDMAKIGAAQDSANAWKAGNQIGTYLSELGFNLDFAPVADVLTNSKNQVVKRRSFGSDAKLVSNMSSSFLEGLQTHPVYGVYKHFPGHGATTEDTHEGYAYIDKTEAQLMENEWIPFIDCMENNVNFVMVGHISVPKITGDNTPATLSSVLMQDILREKLGFEGLIITDALNMGAIQNSYASAEAAVKAFQAGADLLLMPENFTSAYQGIIDAVKNGSISEERLNESVARIIKMKLEIE